MNGIANLKLVGLDSNLFIYHFENNPKFSVFSVKVFDKLSKGTLRAVTSIISVIETLSYPAPSAVVKNIQEAFATIPNLNIMDVDHKIALEAARIRREYKFRLPDSIQLATALAGRVQAFITNDHKLKSFKKIPIVLLNQSNKF